MATKRASGSGHLFIINGDITALHCDAWLFPTDDEFRVTRAFGKVVRCPDGGNVPTELRQPWGRQRVQPLTTESGPQVWLGNVGGTDETRIGHFVECAESFVSNASKSRSGRGRRLGRPLLALPIIGTGDGGGSQRRGEILKALVPRLFELADAHDVDIVLVAWGRVAFEAAQAARRHALPGRPDPWASLDEPVQAAARRVARHAREHNLVVFMGAGVSASAGLPAWQALLDQVASGMGYEPDDLAQLHELDARDQAAVLSRDRKRFATAVHQALETGHFSLQHGLLASLPVNEYVTTNFDQLFELAARNVTDNLVVLPHRTVRPGDRWLAKLHGTLGSDLTLTRSEYHEQRSRYGALFGLLQAMLITRHMLFVGYSLKDEDFNDVVHDVRVLRGGRRSAFATALMDFDNPQLGELWRDLHLVPVVPARPIRNGSTERPKPADWVEVTRRQALFLDLVAHAASDGTSFVTNAAYGALNDAAENELVDALTHLKRVYDRHAGDAKAWPQISEFLKPFDFG